MMRDQFQATSTWQRTPMANYFADSAGTAPDPRAAVAAQLVHAQRLDEIEETLQKAKAGTLPEVALIRAGYISEQEVASIYAEDLFLPVDQQQRRGRRGRQGARRPAAREALHRSADLPAWRCATTCSTSRSSRPRRWGSSTSSSS